MRKIQIGLVVLLASFLVLEAILSLNWPITHDEAPLFYESFLMRAEGRQPYRDLYDFQMPGVYAIFFGIGLLSNYNPLLIRMIDLLLLAALITTTFIMLRNLGSLAAIAASVIFGLKYLEGGPSMALQREYLLLIFIVIGIWFYQQQVEWKDKSFSLSAYPKKGLVNKNGILYLHMTGICMGIATMIKPQAALALVPFLVLEISDGFKPHSGPRVKNISALLAGFTLPILCVFIWLAATGSLQPFLEIVLRYWPLYSQISGQLLVVNGSERWLLVLDQFWRLGGNALWLIPAGLGLYLLLQNSDLSGSNRRQVQVLIWMVVVFGIYPATSGQFFQYHYLPFVYFIIVLASLALTSSVIHKWNSVLFAIFLMVILIEIRPPSAIIQQVEGKSAAAPGGREEKITAYLASHLKPGDSVQPLDWTGGALQAMLTTRARLATTFVFDFYFYHHVSDPYIQGLRSRFINELELGPPAYIVEVTSMDKPWISGPDTSREFPELDEFLDENYVTAVQRDDYNIYVRR